MMSGSSVERNRPCSAVAATYVPDRSSTCDEDAVELGAPILAAVDPQGQPCAELVELADLDRGAERARAQVEAQPLVAIMGPGLRASRR